MRVCKRIGLEFKDEEYFYHGRITDVKTISGKNINITRHLIEDKEGFMVKVDLEDIQFTKRHEPFFTS